MAYGLPAGIVFALSGRTLRPRRLPSTAPSPAAPCPSPRAGPHACRWRFPPVPRSPSPAAQGVQRRRIEHSTLIVIGHGGPFLVGVTWRLPDTYHQAGIERDTATSTSTTRGTTFGSHQPPGEPGLAGVLVWGVGVIGGAAAAGGGAGTGFTRRWSTVFRFEGSWGRRRQLRWRDDLGHRCGQRWGLGGCGRLWCWGYLRGAKGGCWLRRRPDRCVGGIAGSSWVGVGRGVESGHDVGASRNAGGGYRGSCCVLLVCDQGGQYADDGHGDHQKDQQEFIRTWPKKMHLTPPVRPPRTNQIHSTM